MKGVVRFEKTEKLAPRYVGPFPISERIERLAYRVDLPSSLAGVHNVFHVSHLRKYVHDPETTIAPTALEDLVVEPAITFVRQLVRVVAKDEKRLRNKIVRLVKV